MSRIGNLPVTIPSGVEVNVTGDNKVVVTGPKGELTQDVNPAISVAVKDDKVVFSKAEDTKQNRAFHGLYRALVNNMCAGVSTGFKVTQELVGVGYRVAAKGQQLEFTLGFSHPIIMELPKEIKITVETVKGKAPSLTMESADNQLLGMVAAKIRSFRTPEPYKGKGILFKGEEIRRKAGKSAGKK